ncbi:MAG TPA: hypothetical protein VGA50_16210 [Kiloniellales bacterium]|jgi:hypothetical protein
MRWIVQMSGVIDVDPRPKGSRFAARGPKLDLQPIVIVEVVTKHRVRTALAGHCEIEVAVIVDVD